MQSCKIRRTKETIQLHTLRRASLFRLDWKYLGRSLKQPNFKHIIYLSDIYRFGVVASFNLRSMCICIITMNVRRQHASKPLTYFITSFSNMNSHTHTNISIFNHISSFTVSSKKYFIHSRLIDISFGITYDILIKC